MQMLRKSLEKTVVEVEGKAIPAKIYREWRRDVRFSLGKRGAILRMPTVLTKSQEKKQVKQFEQWVQQQFVAKPILNDRFFGKGYQTGDVLTVGNRQYTLDIAFTANKTHTARLKGNQIFLKLTQNDTEVHLQKAIKHLLSRLVAQDFLPAIKKRVEALNAKHFQKEIKNVKLKYNATNWGSCSSKKNVNLSTRLLFAPDEVIDYVIIHELAHLIEMNHSPRFWAIVHKAMPNYKEKEQWLKKNGHLCDF